MSQGIEKTNEVGHRKLWTHREPALVVSPMTSSTPSACCESSVGMFPLQTNACKRNVDFGIHGLGCNIFSLSMGFDLTSIAL